MTFRLVHQGAERRGATATEYGLLVGFIAIAIVLGVRTVRERAQQLLHALATWIAAAI